MPSFPYPGTEDKQFRGTTHIRRTKTPHLSAARERGSPLRYRIPVTGETRGSLLGKYWFSRPAREGTLCRRGLHPLAVGTGAPCKARLAALLPLSSPFAIYVFIIRDTAENVKRKFSPPHGSKSGRRNHCGSLRLCDSVQKGDAKIGGSAENAESGAKDGVSAFSPCGMRLK